MTSIAVAVALVVEAGLFLGVLSHLYRGMSRERQVWVVERANLLDRLMLLADKPWTPPPVLPELERDEVELTVADPDQFMWEAS